MTKRVRVEGTVIRLGEMQLLAGIEEEISMTEFRKRPGDVIAQVQMGKTFVLVKGGKRVATLTKQEPSALEIGAEVRRLGLVV